jgi:MFS family permease
MGSVASILLLTWAYDLFEIKWLMIGSIVTFEIGSAICGAAPTMNGKVPVLSKCTCTDITSLLAMIVGRVVAGVGGAGMYLGFVCHRSFPS